MLIPVTEIQLNILFFMKRSNFATDWRCLADTGIILQINVAMHKTEQNTLEECTAGWLLLSLGKKRV